MRKITVFYGHFAIFCASPMGILLILLQFPEKKLRPVVIFASVGFETTEFWGRDPTQMNFSHPNGSFEKFSIISLNKSGPRPSSEVGAGQIGAGLDPSICHRLSDQCGAGPLDLRVGAGLVQL